MFPVSRERGRRLGKIFRESPEKGVYFVIANVTNTRDRWYIFFPRHGVQVIGNEHRYTLIIWEWGGGGGGIIIFVSIIHYNQPRITEVNVNAFYQKSPMWLKCILFVLSVTEITTRWENTVLCRVATSCVWRTFLQANRKVQTVGVNLGHWNSVGF